MWNLDVGGEDAVIDDLLSGRFGLVWFVPVECCFWFPGFWFQQLSRHGRSPAVNAGANPWRHEEPPLAPYCQTPYLSLVPELELEPEPVNVKVTVGCRSALGAYKPPTGPGLQAPSSNQGGQGKVWCLHPDVS